MTESRPEYAFPVSSIDGYTQSGMTLRDYFAAAALPAIFAAQRFNADLPIPPDPFENAARVSYLLADAMLIAREKE